MGNANHKKIAIGMSVRLLVDWRFKLFKINVLITVYKKEFSPYAKISLYKNNDFQHDFHSRYDFSQHSHDNVVLATNNVSLSDIKLFTSDTINLKLSAQRWHERKLRSKGIINWNPN